VRQHPISCTAFTVGNSTHPGCNDWATATTFRELFRPLDAKRFLRGSQKRYTAAELKKLINHVRTTQPPLHLPLEVIPATGGLRQRVKALLDADAAAARTETGPGPHNLHQPCIERVRRHYARLHRKFCWQYIATLPNPWS
jgi:hypothetical protein